MVFEADNIDWLANAGQLLDRLARALPAHPRLEIKKDIDVRAHIIRPALERAERQHRDFDPTLKTRLASVNLPPKNE